jgi:hypothetical protein
MTEPFDLRDYAEPDDIRDRFNWAQFSNPRFVAMGIVLCLVVFTVLTRDPAGQTRNAGYEAATSVLDSAHRLARAQSAPIDSTALVPHGSQ